MTTIPKPKDLLTVFSDKYDAWNRLANLDAGATATFRYNGLNLSKGFGEGKVVHGGLPVGCIRRQS